MEYDNIFQVVKKMNKNCGGVRSSCLCLCLCVLQAQVHKVKLPNIAQCEPRILLCVAEKIGYAPLPKTTEWANELSENQTSLPQSILLVINMDLGAEF